MTSSGCPPPPIGHQPASARGNYSPTRSHPSMASTSREQAAGRATLGALHLTVYDARMLWSSPYDALRARKCVVDSTSDV